MKHLWPKSVQSFRLCTKIGHDRYLISELPKKLHTGTQGVGGDLYRNKHYSNVRRWPQLKATSSEATPMEGGLNGRRPQRRSTSMKGDATSKEGDLRWRQHQRKATQPQWKVTSTEAASTDCDLNGKRPQRKTTLHWLRRILISCCWLTIMPALYKLVKIC